MDSIQTSSLASVAALNETSQLCMDHAYDYQVIFDNMLNGFAHCRMLFENGRPIDFVYLKVNQAFERQTGLKDVTGKKVSEVLPGIGQSDFGSLEIYGRVASQGTPETFEIYLAALGQWFSVSAYCPRPGEFVAVFDVITERKLAQAQLKRRESQLAAIYDNAYDVLFVVAVEPDFQFRFALVNRRFLEATQLREDQIVGKLVREVIPEPSCSMVLDKYKRAAQECKVVQWEEVTDYPSGRKVGMVRVVPLMARDGVCTQLIGVVQDVTELKDKEAELVRHRDSLERLVEDRTAELLIAKQAAESATIAKSVFLSNMSHELRTPLNAILGFSELMERDTSIAESARRRLGMINRAGKHLLSLINDVLEISRIEAGHAAVEQAPFDLMDLLSSVEEMIRPRAESKGLAFVVLHDSSLPTAVLGDASHLKQVLINLLGNASKYTDQGRVQFHVKRGSDDMICFEVTDTGVGISAEDQEKLFQPFYQTPTAIAKGEGTGLGLAISQEYTRLMRGRLEVRSQPGQGSVFTLTVPLPVSSLALAPHSTRRVLRLEPGQGEIKILLVDDKSDNLALVSELISEAGFSIRTATNGQQAMDVFASWQPHLIWMDMRMPVMDGYEATHRIRQMPGGDRVKIVALTASAFEEDRPPILAAGCDDLVRKPLEEERLFSIMGQLLGLRYCYDVT